MAHVRITPQGLQASRAHHTTGTAGITCASRAHHVRITPQGLQASRAHHVRITPQGLQAYGVFVGLQLSSTQVGLCHPLKPYRMAGPRSHACARACTHAHADPAAGAEGLEGMVAAAGDEGTRGGGGAGVVGPAPASRVYPTEIPGVGRRRKPRRGQEVRGGHSA